MIPAHRIAHARALAFFFLSGEGGICGESFAALVARLRAARAIEGPLSPMAQAILEVEATRAAFSRGRRLRQRAAWRRYRARKGKAWDTERRSRYPRKPDRRNRREYNRRWRKRPAYRRWWNARQERKRPALQEAA